MKRMTLTRLVLPLRVVKAFFFFAANTRETGLGICLGSMAGRRLDKRLYTTCIRVRLFLPNRGAAEDGEKARIRVGVGIYYMYVYLGSIDRGKRDGVMGL